MQSNFKFVHPGTFMSPVATQQLQKSISLSQTRKAALAKMIKDTPLSYNPRAIRIVDIDWGGKGSGHDECTKDAEMAVSAAMLLWATNDEKYGELCFRILKSWATTNVVFKGNNAPLEAAWCTCSFSRAAELIRYHAKTAAQWKSLETLFFKWIDVVMMPPLKDRGVWTWKIRGNWHFSVLCARMQIAILREDTREFWWCVETYKEILGKAIIKGECVGENAETRRDCTHSMFLLGGLVQLPEMALHQGIDLYNDCLIDCFELQSQIMMQQVPKGLCKEDIKTPYGFWPEPVFEIPYAHFVGRKGKSMPWTAKYLKKIRPERVTFHWGGNTLTHGIEIP